ncbi:hypothetical protein RMSM_02543 [Rhodopirellula maiorica SM1]|uniref:Uncharacterized protein n=2 Tax=Novipirellula TaxID=2795426 RepID=M5RMT5_9BACT|nr:hypothetical protein RMSM_02543 [Rhodopirellula maiorica SM1]
MAMRSMALFGVVIEIDGHRWFGLYPAIDHRQAIVTAILSASTFEHIDARPEHCWPVKNFGCCLYPATWVSAAKFGENMQFAHGATHLDPSTWAADFLEIVE